MEINVGQADKRRGRFLDQIKAGLSQGNAPLPKIAELLLDQTTPSRCIKYYLIKNTPATINIYCRWSIIFLTETNHLILQTPFSMYPVLHPPPIPGPVLINQNQS